MWLCCVQYKIRRVCAPHSKSTQLKWMYPFIKNEGNSVHYNKNFTTSTEEPKFIIKPFKPVASHRPISQEHFSSLMHSCSIPDDGSASLLVGVSGGSDSMALCLLLHEWTAKTRSKLLAVTVDHGLRREAGLEAAQVNEWLSRRQIAHSVMKIDWPMQVPKNSQNARKFRYSLLSAVAKEHQVGYILTAHHLEDQIETFWINVAHLSNLFGMVGIPRTRAMEGLPGVVVARPNLRGRSVNIHNSFLREICLMDSTTRIRKALKEVYNLVPPSQFLLLLKTTSEARQEIETQVQSFLTMHTKFQAKDVWMDKTQFLRLPEHVAFRVLMKILMDLKQPEGSHYYPKSQQILHIYKAINQDNKKKHTHYGTLAGYLISKSEDWVIIKKAIHKTDPVITSHHLT